jgi:MoxR-like ATPase
MEIVLLHAPEMRQELARRMVEVIEMVRALDLKKPPSIAESIDWARTLVALGLQTLDEEVVSQTMGVVLKHASDHVRAAKELGLN